MTTATALLNRRLLEMAINGDRPRCADPITHEMWISEDPHDRDMSS